MFQRELVLTPVTTTRPLKRRYGDDSNEDERYTGVYVVDDEYDDEYDDDDEITKTRLPVTGSSKWQQQRSNNSSSILAAAAASFFSLFSCCQE